jgi:arylsulfatase A-like enzyme/tetratricopeptide (TPR) repeat protein
VSRDVARAVGAALLLAATAACGGPTTLPPGTPVVLISIDTLRSDRLPAYGYAGVETPALDRLAAESVLFERAYSHYPLTLPSHASLLTGLLPPDTGVRNNKEALLREESRTLTERLAEAGYLTAGFVSSVVLRESTGIAQGFEHYDDATAAAGGGVAGGRAAAERRGDDTVAAVAAWLAGRDEERPPFLFVHLFDPHTPHAAPEPFGSRYDDPYDAEIAWTDRQVGALLDALREAGLYERALIVLLSDHGEGLGDHVEQEHGLFLYREALQVPLLVRLPGARRAGERVGTTAGLIDVAPTLLDLLGLDPDDLPGHTLLDRAPPADRPLYAETSFPRYQYRWSDLRSVIVDHEHYIEAPRPELYDLAADPGEADNLLPGRPVPDVMLAALAEVGAGFESTVELSPEELRQLASLGYVGAQSGGPAAGAELPDPKDHIEAAEAMWAEVRRAELTGDLDAVRAALDGMDALGLRNEALFRNIASNLMHGGHPVAALESMRPLLESEQAASQLLLGSIRFEVGEADAAAGHYRRALEAEPGHARASFGLGALHELAGEDRRAIERYRTAAAADPDHVPTRLRLAETLRRVGDAEAALEHYAAVLAAEPLRAEARLGRAMALVRLGRWADARAALEESARLLPEQPAFPHALARLLVAAPEAAVRDPQRAMRLLRPLMRTGPSTDLAETVAMALAESGRFDEALEWQGRALDIAREAGRRDDARRIAANLERYRDGEPCRVPWPDDHPLHRPPRDVSPALASLS